MDEQTKELLRVVGEFNLITDLPDEVIIKLAESELTNYAFLPSWVTQNNDDGVGHMNGVAGVKVLRQRGYRKTENVLKEMFILLGKTSSEGCNLLLEYVLSMPREYKIQGFKDIILSCYNFEGMVQLQDYEYLFFNLKISKYDFSKKEQYLWNWFYKYQSRLFHNKYDTLFKPTRYFKMKRKTKKLIEEVGEFNKTDNLPDDIIKKLVKSDISNYTFLPFWVKDDYSDGVWHLSDEAGTKVLIGRGYKKIKNIIKEIFYALSDSYWDGYLLLYDFLLSMPRKLIVAGLVKTVQACRDRENDAYFDDYEYLFSELPIYPIKEKEFGDKELYQWFQRGLKHLFGHEYEYFFKND